MVDSAFFWTSQVIGTAVWGLFFILKVLTLSVFWVKPYLFRAYYCLFAVRCAGPTSTLTINAEEITRKNWETSRKWE